MKSLHTSTVLLYPLSTEKSVDLLTRNTLGFIVALRATKTQIKSAVEQQFKVKVRKVVTQVLPSGEKKAYVSLDAAHSANDVATKLGLL